MDARQSSPSLKAECDEVPALFTVSLVIHLIFLEHSKPSLLQMRSELNAFVDEQRIFCGFLDTEQRLVEDS